MAVVYLELENVSDRGNPMHVYFDIHRALRAELFDAVDKVVSRAGVSADIETPTPYWIALPHDSRLRFRVSVSGYGISKDGGYFVGLMSGAWQIPASSTGEYSLSSEFDVSPPKDSPHRRPWTGTLKLPKVKLPLVAP